MKTKPGGRTNLLQQLFAMMLALVLAVADVPAAGLGGVFALGTVHAEGALTITVPEDFVGVAETRAMRPMETFYAGDWVSGGTAPYTFSKMSGPEWITVLDDGTVTGVPLQIYENNEKLVVEARDRFGATASVEVPVGSTEKVATAQYNPNPPYGINYVEDISYSSLVHINTDGRRLQGSAEGAFLGRRSFEDDSKDVFYYKNDGTVSHDAIEDYNAWYDPDTGILTLRNYDGGGIMLGIQKWGLEIGRGTAVIRLIGHSTITVEQSGNNDAVGILSGKDGDVVITGEEGSSIDINVTTESGLASGISNLGYTDYDYSNEACECGGVTICGNAEVNIRVEQKGNPNASYKWTASGIRAFDELSILEHSSVNVCVVAKGYDNITWDIAKGLYCCNDSVSKVQHMHGLTLATDGKVEVSAKYKESNVKNGTTTIDIDHWNLFLVSYLEAAYDQYYTQSMLDSMQSVPTFAKGVGIRTPGSVRNYIAEKERFSYVKDTENLKEIYHMAHATITDRIFTGSIGHAAASTADEANSANQCINVSLSGVSRDDLADASAIRITNLPEGMQQETRWIDGTTTARIYVYGAPEKVSEDQVQVEIGAESTTLGVPITPEKNPNTRFFITDGEQIKRVAVTAGLPNKLYVGGQLPKYADFSVSEDAGYKITDFGWYAAENTSFETRLSAGDDVSDGAVLESGVPYYAEFTVETEDGYVFAPEASIIYSLNNSRVDMSISRVNDSKVILKKAYTALGAADAGYALSFIDPEDAGNTWTETVKGNGTVCQLENYLTEPKGRELDHWN